MNNIFREEILGEGSLARLTVPPGIWFGFKGLGLGVSLVLNIADIPHEPTEAQTRSKEEFLYDWSLV
jgi:dTDP-4-dehydrorhamnose 3,5-epimerase